MGAHAAALWRRARFIALGALAATTIQPAAQPFPGHPVGRPAATLAHGRPAGSTPRTPDRGPNDPFYDAPGYRWVFRQTGLDDMWRETVGAASIVVAVVDTGVAAVPDLRGALLPQVDLVGGDDALDPNGHGTAVASVLAARIDNRIGIAGACGRCTILPIRVAAPDGTAPVDEIARGVRFAIDHGARIVNVSLAAPTTSPALSAAVAHAEDAGVLVVAAAGNGGADAPAYPAALPGVVSVAAAAASGHLYPFSNRGATVALAAPGCAVVALRDASYGTACGTSIAAPLVAGAAALLASIRPDASGPDLAAALEDGARSPGVTTFGQLDVVTARALLRAR